MTRLDLVTKARKQGLTVVPFGEGEHSMVMRSEHACIVLWNTGEITRWTPPHQRGEALTIDDAAKVLGL